MSAEIIAFPSRFEMREAYRATGGIVGLQNVRGSLLVLRDALKAARDEMEGA